MCALGVRLYTIIHYVTFSIGGGGPSPISRCLDCMIITHRLNNVVRHVIRMCIDVVAAVVRHRIAGYIHL